MLVRKISSIILSVSLVTGIVSGDVVRVAVASNFANTAKALEPMFEKQTGHELILSIGSTGKHFAQIQNGAPFDVFLAADMERPRLLEEAGLAIKGSRFTYAMGTVVLLSLKTDVVNSAGDVLGEGNFNHLAIANPKLAPYGRAGQQILEHLNLWESLQSKIVRGENIAQTFQFVSSGNAEFGFVAKSQIMRPGKEISGSYLELDTGLHDPIEQQAVLLTDSDAARRFVGFLRSDDARKLIEDFGYSTELATLATEPRPSNDDSTSFDWLAIWITLRLALISTIVLLVIGTPLAWWLVRTNFRYKVVIEAIVALPLVLPPTVLGFYLLIMLGPSGPVGRLLDVFGVSPLVFTFSGLVIGSVVYSLPFVVQPLQSAMAAIGERPREAAATLRASPLDRFVSVVVPLAWPGFVTATVLGFAHTVGEFGVVLMIGGNIPNETQVLSISIYDHVEALEYGQAHWLAGGLLAFSFILLVTVYSINRKFLTLNRWV